MRKIYRTVRMAVVALRRNVMRSVLTTLGIIIGVGAVITMMEIGKGSSTAVKQTIATRRPKPWPKSDRPARMPCRT